jgi:hypothetical protein
MLEVLEVLAKRFPRARARAERAAGSTVNRVQTPAGALRLEIPHEKGRITAEGSFRGSFDEMRGLFRDLRSLNARARKVSDKGGDLTFAHGGTLTFAFEGPRAIGRKLFRVHLRYEHGRAHAEKLAKYLTVARTLKSPGSRLLTARALARLRKIETPAKKG